MLLLSAGLKYVRAPSLTLEPKVMMRSEENHHIVRNKGITAVSKNASAKIDLSKQV